MKAKDIRNMSKEEKDAKFKELKLELIKSKVNTAKSGSGKTREIRKLIARILTSNNTQQTK